MISDLDRTLEQLFKSEFGAALPFDLSFSIPDKNFTTVSNTRNTLDCYLYDIREDRERRSVEPLHRRNADGTSEKMRPPARIKLTYCITSWSPAQVTPGTMPVLDEHSLLSDVLRVLLKHPTLPPEVLSGTLLGQEPLLPTTVVLPDGPKSATDLWNAIGGQLRPSLDYSVTISLDYMPRITGDTVTSARVGYENREELFAIGGVVYDSRVPGRGVASAWTRVAETGATYVTDEDGLFRVGRIARGNYTLIVRAVGFHEGNKAVQVPQPDGALYDVTLVPL